VRSDDFCVTTFSAAHLKMVVVVYPPRSWSSGPTMPQI
jgi:hypothetical protein